MGGDLSGETRPRHAVPNFLIAVLRDQDGANLDRAQIIKGWLDKKGSQHELIYDVAATAGISGRHLPATSLNQGRWAGKRAW